MLHPFLGPPALLLLVAAVALGGVPLERAIDRRLGAAPLDAPPRRRSVERWLVLFALGAVSWMALLFALASLQLLRPPVMVPLLAALALTGALLLQRSRGRRARDGGEAEDRGSVRQPGEATGAAGPALASPPVTSTRRSPESIALLALGATLAVVIAGLWLHALRPDVATDADVYHLTLPRLYLEHGGFYRVPWSVYSNWPLGLELLFAAAMAAADHVLASQLHFAFGVLALVVAARLAATDLPAPSSRRSVPALAALVAAVLVLFNAVVLFEIRVAYVDLAQAFFLALGALRLERVHARQEPAGRGLLLVGLCCGAMAALKPNGFFGAVPLVALALWLIWRQRRHEASAAATWPSPLRALLLIGAPAAALALPWVIKTWLLTGNPVYPFLHDVFGGPEWNAELSERFTRWQRAIGMGREPLDYLLLPLRVILFGDFGYARFDGGLHPAWIVFLPLAVLGAWRDARARRLLAMVGAFFVLWAATAQQMRFLIPALPLLAAAAARGGLALLQALPHRPRHLRTLLATVTPLALAVLLVRSAGVYLEQSPRLARDYARWGTRLHEAVRPPVYRWIDDTLPPDAKLLLLGTNRGFFVPRDYVADSFFEASQIGAVFATADSPASAHRLLLDLDISHVLLDAGGPKVPYPRGLGALVSGTGGRGLRSVFSSQDGRYHVLAVEPLGAMP